MQIFFNFYEFKNILLKIQKKIDYLVIYANYLHLNYKLAIKYNLNVICEKPLVLNIHQLKVLKKRTKILKEIYCILQLRLNKT